MKKRMQAGFAIIELTVIVVVLAVIAGSGYYVWHRHNQKEQPVVTTTTTAAAASSQAAPTSAPAAPQVKKASDLNSAMQALDQTDTSASNGDNSQLSSQASGF